MSYMGTFEFNPSIKYMITAAGYYRGIRLMRRLRWRSIESEIQTQISSDF